MNLNTAVRVERDGQQITGWVSKLVPSHGYLVVEFAPVKDSSYFRGYNFGTLPVFQNADGTYCDFNGLPLQVTELPS